MFTANDITAAAINKAVLLFDGYSRGDVIHWNQIEDAIGVRRSEQSFYGIVRRARLRTQRQRGIVTLAQKDVGVRFLNDKDFGLILENRQARAARQVHRGIRELDCIETSSLNMHEKKVIAAQSASMRNERRELRRSLRSFRKSIKTESLPRRQLVESK